MKWGEIGIFRRGTFVKVTLTVKGWDPLFKINKSSANETLEPLINTSDDVTIIDSQLENTSLRDIERRDGYEDIENVGIREIIEKSDEYEKYEETS